MPRSPPRHSQTPAAPAMQGSPWQRAEEVNGKKGGSSGHRSKRKDTSAPAAGLPGLTGAGPSKLPKMATSHESGDEGAAPPVEAAAGGEQCQPQGRGPYRPTVNAKTCKLCLSTSTDDDPVAQAMGEGGEVALRWDRKSTKVCYYCARVHERKYRQLTRQELVHQLRSQPKPNADGANAELDQFLAFRALAVNLMAARGEGGRMSKGFVNMEITPWS